MKIKNIIQDYVTYADVDLMPLKHLIKGRISEQLPNSTQWELSSLTVNSSYSELCDSYFITVSTIVAYSEDLDESQIKTVLDGIEDYLTATVDLTLTNQVKTHKLINIEKKAYELQ